MIKPPIQGPYYPGSTHFRIHLKQGSILSGFRQVNQGSILSNAHLLWESMWSCAIPHPKVVQSIPCTCSASFIWGGTSRGRLYSTQVYSTQLASPLGKRRRTEEKVTLLAKLVDLTCMFSINTMPVYSARSVVVGDLSRPQVLVGFSRVVLQYQQSSFVTWLLCNQFLTQSGCHHVVLEQEFPLLTHA